MSDANFRKALTGYDDKLRAYQKGLKGIRQDLIDHLRRLGPGVARWPGGCFADKYHWRDGIGDPAGRPRRYGRWKDDTESNAFGTREFMDFCRLCELRPYLAGNVGTLLKNLEFSLAMENQIMGAILDDKEQPEAAAKAWLKANPQVLEQWLAGVKTYDGAEALPAVKGSLGL